MSKYVKLHQFEAMNRYVPCLRRRWTGGKTWSLCRWEGARKFDGTSVKEHKPLENQHHHVTAWYLLLFLSKQHTGRSSSFGNDGACRVWDEAMHRGDGRKIAAAAEPNTKFCQFCWYGHYRAASRTLTTDAGVFCRFDCASGNSCHSHFFFLI